MAWTESGLFYASWRDTLKQAPGVPISLLDTNNKLSLSGVADTPNFQLDPATWSATNEVTGGGSWPTGGIQLVTGTYAPTLTSSGTSPLLLKWDMNDLSIASTTTTAAAYGAYIYANGLSPKAMIIAVWFGGSGYSTNNGTFAITWNTAGIATIQMAA